MQANFISTQMYVKWQLLIHSCLQALHEKMSVQRAWDRPDIQIQILRELNHAPGKAPGHARQPREGLASRKPCPCCMQALKELEVCN